MKNFSPPFSARPGIPFEQARTQARRFFRPLLVAGAFFALLTLAACSKDDDDDLQPTGTKPDWGTTITDRMQVVIEQFQAFGTPPLPTLAPAQARMTPSVTDAVKTLLANG